ncbi:MAG TPA: polysaccharide pyruvyl transferase family protein [Armatimonadetes bacterium]|nr:polysaccharide pyruvyl transferase family protein [Armatimonadota bacterium]
MKSIRATTLYRRISDRIVQPLRFRRQYAEARLAAAMRIGYVPAKWCRESNWGDSLNPFLIKAISGLPVRFTSHPSLLKYVVIGSTIGTCDSNSIVWGAGAIAPSVKLNAKPLKVCAVRGPLTRQLLLEQGVDVPRVYGDPALLLPRFFRPDANVRYDVGIIPHYMDNEHPWLDRYRNSQSVCIIDVTGERLGFIRQVNECRHIVSSSLHGIICADAYGIPATWIELSDRVIGSGFKFRDYFASVGRQHMSSVQVTRGTDLENILSEQVPYSVQIDIDALYTACPFRRELNA